MYPIPLIFRKKGLFLMLLLLLTLLLSTTNIIALVILTVIIVTKIQAFLHKEGINIGRPINWLLGDRMLLELSMWKQN